MTLEQVELLLETLAGIKTALWIIAVALCLLAGTAVGDWGRK